jgi:hypothetical protein
MWYRWTLILLLLPLVTVPARAGILFGRKKDKPDPKQRVPQLVGALKSEKDADARSRAAEGLREYDPAAFAEIVPALIDSMNSDPSPGVRIESAHTLAKLRPVSQAVGEALEQAVSRDSSMRVRLQVRSALLQYHWAGYRSKKGDVPPLNTTREPPLGPEAVPPVNSTLPAPPANNQPRIRPVPVPPVSAPPKVPTTKEPPLQPPPPVAAPAAPASPEANPVPSPKTDGGPDLS